MNQWNTPKVTRAQYDEVLRLRQKGRTIASIAKELNLSASRVFRIVNGDIKPEVK